MAHVAEAGYVKPTLEGKGKKGQGLSFPHHNPEYSKDLFLLQDLQDVRTEGERGFFVHTSGDS